MGIGNVVFLLLVIIIVFLIFGIYFLTQTAPLPPPNPNDFVNTFQANAFWSTPIPGPNSPQNTCRVYTFPIIRFAEGQILPGSPSLVPEIIGRASAGDVQGGCIDVDQIQAQQLQHTCIGPTGVTGQNSNEVWCIRGDGTRASLGETEVFFSTAPCNAPQCTGVLGGISLNFNPPDFVKCIRKIEGQPVNTFSNCFEADEGLFGWRITRVNPGQDPASKPPGQSSTGIIAQIFARNENQCLAPEPPIGEGSRGILVPCSSTPNNGFNWAFLPPLAPIGTPEFPFPSPPQIAYVGNFKTSTIPTDPVELRRWVEQNTPIVLQYEPGPVLLADYVFTNAVQETLAQYIDYNLLNILLQIEACCTTENGTIGPCSNPGSSATCVTL